MGCYVSRSVTAPRVRVACTSLRVPCAFVSTSIRERRETAPQQPPGQSIRSPPLVVPRHRHWPFSPFPSRHWTFNVGPPTIIHRRPFFRQQLPTTPEINTNTPSRPVPVIPFVLRIPTTQLRCIKERATTAQARLLLPPSLTPRSSKTTYPPLPVITSIGRLCNSLSTTQIEPQPYRRLYQIASTNLSLPIRKPKLGRIRDTTERYARLQVHQPLRVVTLRPTYSGPGAIVDENKSTAPLAIHD